MPLIDPLDTSITQSIDHIPIHTVRQIWLDFIAESYDIPIHAIHTTTHLNNGLTYNIDNINIYIIIKELGFAIRGGRSEETSQRIEYLLSAYLEYQLPESILDEIILAYDQHDILQIKHLLILHEQYLYPLPHNYFTEREVPGQFQDILKAHLDRIKIVLPLFSRGVFYHAVAGSQSHDDRQPFGIIHFIYSQNYLAQPSQPPQPLEDEHQDENQENQDDDQDDDQDSVYDPNEFLPLSPNISYPVPI